MPSARRFIGSMDAPCPAARSLFAFQQRVMRSHDTSLPGCGLLGIIDPADELVSTERRQRFPQGQYARVRSNGGLKVVLSLVHSAMEKSISQKTSTPVCRDRLRYATGRRKMTAGSQDVQPKHLCPRHGLSRWHREKRASEVAPTTASTATKAGAPPPGNCRSSYRRARYRRGPSRTAARLRRPHRSPAPWSHFRPVRRRWHRRAACSAT